MKKNLFVLILSILVFSLFQISCEKKTIRSRETDWDAVKAIISEYPDVFRLGFYDTVSDTIFYREITRSNADIEEGTRFDADSEHPFVYIILSWEDSLKGTFHYRSNGKAYEKPISSVALTYAYFEKWGYDTDTHRGWLLKQFSGTVINSKGTTRDIDELHIVSEGADVYLYETTLMNLVYKDSTLAFGKGKQVTFTVKTGDTTDLLSLFVKEAGTYQKIPFTSNGDGTFSAGWTTLPNPDPAIKYYHAIVDLVSRESVTDTTSTNYDSQAWGIIYRIK